MGLQADRPTQQAADMLEPFVRLPAQVQGIAVVVLAAQLLDGRLQRLQRLGSRVVGLHPLNQLGGLPGRSIQFRRNIFPGGGDQLTFRPQRFVTQPRQVIRRSLATVLDVRQV